tara:strand:- start:1693 stop:3243 length:1551 start_codon:yes stop_codon:yes gene_type:complete
MKRYVIALTSGFVLGIGTLVYPLWPISLFSFIGISYLIETSALQRQLRRELFVASFVTYGLSFYALFWHTLPLDWLGLTGLLGIGIIGSVWLITAGAFAATFALVVSFAKRLPPGRSLVVAVPSLYVLADAIGTFVFSLIFYGPAATIGLHFSMGSPGYQLADSDVLRQAATVGGLYALVFLQAAFGCGLYFIVHSYRNWRRVLIVCAWLGFTTLSVHNFDFSPGADSDAQLLQVGIISTYTNSMDESPSEQIWRQLYTLPNTIELAVLPEDRRIIQQLSITQATSLRSYFVDAHILDSGSIAGADGLIPEIQLLSSESLTVATSSKTFLMVFGEYMPLLYNVIGHVIGQGSVVEELQTTRGYTTLPPTLLPISNIFVSARLCSDAMSPFFYARDAKQGAGILVNLASHTWFHYSPTIHQLSVRVGQVRATESRRWYIRAGNDSPAYVINSRGEVVKEASWFKPVPLVVTVPIITSYTPYSIMRGFILVVLFVVVLCLFAIQRARIATGNRNNSKG